MNDKQDEDLLHLMRERRSVRRFNGQKIPAATILEIIEAGVWAPTGCNNQEIRFLTIDDEARLAEIISFKPFFRGVSTVVLLFCDMSLPMSTKMYCQYDHEKHLPYVDTGLAMANMILYAKSMGISSCIFNLSKYHFKKSDNRSITSRIKRSIMRRLGGRPIMRKVVENYLIVVPRGPAVAGASKASSV